MPGGKLLNSGKKPKYNEETKTVAVAVAVSCNEKTYKTEIVPNSEFTPYPNEDINNKNKFF